MIKSLKRGIIGLNKTSDIISPFHIEIDNRGSEISLLIYEVKKVLDFSDKFVKIKCRIGSVSIAGEGISINTYEYKTIEIKGKISVLEFNYAKN